MTALYDLTREDWGPPGGTVWVNPPFVGHGSNVTAWARKSIEQARERNVVMIAPVFRRVHRMVEAGFHLQAPPPFEWLNPAGKIRKKASLPPALLFIKRLDQRCPTCGHEAKP